MLKRSQPRPTEKSSVSVLIIAAVWVAAFTAVFFTTSFDDPKIHRTEFLGWMLDEILGDRSPLSGESADSVKSISVGTFIAQRLGILTCATVLLSSAWLIGGTLALWLMPALPLLRTERIVLRGGLGLSSLSLMTLVAGQFGMMSPFAVPVIGCAAGGYLLVSSRRSTLRQRTQPVLSMDATSRLDRWLMRICLAIIIPFVVWMVAVAMSPQNDFDVREYHLQGPKEWFQAGRISFLRHNVYTSFPFLSEMLSLSAMILRRDWWQGALAGQVVLASFQLLTMLAVYAISRRWIGATSAWIAVLVCVTTPWTFRLTLIAYAEGALTFYLAASVMSSLLLSVCTCRADFLRVAGVTGFLAGSAMACKYTGLVSVIVPVFVILSVTSWKPLVLTSKNPAGDRVAMAVRSRLRLIFVACGAGIVLAVGPWLLRNVLDTGNPVYPLGYAVFGGREWSPEMDAKWKPAHAPAEHELRRIPDHFLDAATRNKWTSPLLFGLGVPAVFLWRRNRAMKFLLPVIIWNFLTWWAFTHRIDRFWIPAIPLLAVAASAVWMLSRQGLWKIFLLSIIALGTAWNIRFCATSLVGFHAGLTDLNAARQQVIRDDLRQLNDSLVAGSKVLLVGEAEVFDATFPLIYNTVFDDCFFEDWTVDPDDLSQPRSERRLRPPREIREQFQSAGITHVFVNWGEILRYRQPGSYGFTEYVQPEKFQQLIASGVLEPSTALLTRAWSGVSEGDQSLVKSWPGWQRLLTVRDELIVVEIFRVATTQ